MRKLFRVMFLHDTPDDTGGGAAPAEPQSVREAIAARQASDNPSLAFPSDAPVEPVAPVEPDPVEAAIDELAPAPPAAGSVEAPAIDAPAAGTPDPFAEYGGADEVRNAVTLANAMRSEQGMRAVIANGLHALGYSPEQVRAALQNQGATPAEATAAVAAAPAAEVDPLADITDDDVVTGGDLKRIVQATIEKTARETAAALAAATKPLEDQVQVERQSRAQQTVDGTLVELLGAPPADAAGLAQYQELANGVLTAAANGFDQNQWDPAYIRSAIIKGHQAFTSQQDRALAAYAARKRAERAAAPAHVGGSQQAGAEALPEPKNVKEAIAQRKAAGVQ